MKIEKLTDKHLQACCEIYVETFNAEPWNDNWNEKTAYKRLADIYNTPGFMGLAAVEGKELKGAVFGNLEQWYEGCMYNLKEMFVRFEDKGCGVGSALLKTLETSLKDVNAGSIVLFTSKGDFTERFYEKNEFSTVEDMIMMSKNI